MLRKGKKFLLYWWHPLCYKSSDKSRMRKWPGCAYDMWNKNVDIIFLVISWSPSLFQALPLHYKNNFMFMLTHLRFVCDLNMTMLPCTVCLSSSSIYLLFEYIQLKTMVKTQWQISVDTRIKSLYARWLKRKMCHYWI